jgi:iron complex outermembrane receptor protein
VTAHPPHHGIAQQGALRAIAWAIAERAALTAALALNATAIAQPQNPFDLTIEELGDVRVTTVSRRSESQNQAAASVYVITADEIRRSGVRTIAEALRLAPGVEVARSSSAEWTISIRGLNSDLSNKLLVLIDGRSAYSPLFAGVFWDVQDTLLNDIERIEVVSGPGGTLWGGNAVNGVVNIITRTPAETQGTFVEVGAGNEEEAFASFRHGFTISETMTARAYVKHFERDAAELASGASAGDDWEVSRAGFALEWKPNERDSIDLRADVYEGEEQVLVRGEFTVGTLPGPSEPGRSGLAGRNVVVNWLRTLGSAASFGVQVYYDYTDRQIPRSFDEARDTWNVAWQHDVADIGRHDLHWGVDLRSTHDDIGNTLFASFIPPSRSDRTISAFLQDRIELRAERLYLTLGAKLEHNDYTGSEEQPNVRLAWLPSDRHTVWAAVSRAVRVPARLNSDIDLFAPIGPLQGLPFYVNVRGSDNFDSEEVTAYEAGYRAQVNERLSLDLALFDNYYDRLQTQEPGPFTAVPGPPAYFVLPALLANGMEGETYGGTLAVSWQPLSQWRLRMHYAYLQMDLMLKPGSNDSGALNVAGNSPQSEVGAHSYVELPAGFSVYAGVRYVDELPAQSVPSYTAVDAGVEWARPGRPWRASLTVHNLNDERHLEFGGNTFIERSVFGRVSWAF